ncbi:hypothetical protein CHGG_06683 [Chaetomium globosum CBS 148.51]|uniref:BCS1 N-terminal domain-containing protein n=1 Tax=Chaetomium globosum (strain ATCC 6205 / CBS 148.51 / DSM 1962 / NBRC 6347 / NRRL 1970) TaxID=306901 RepID=Q2H3T2_CHAGB|nr:uncharacterized protein CHGG_06683 [Chaetomium globosum CBS 148.51]EAQ90064.1 hypothetical protein CHGG_06683 [Chaetomium globosum CBS 148.51]
MANNTTFSTPLIATQVSVLDFFVPGSSSILAAIELVLGTNSYIRPLMLCMFLAFLGRRVFRFVWDVAETYFVSTVHVQYGSEVYDMVNLWATSQPFARRARSSMARVGWKSPSYSDFEEDRHRGRRRKKLLYYLPWNGTFYFSYNEHLFWFRSREKENDGYLQQVVTVSCFGSPTVLRQLFDDCRDGYLKLTNNKTAVFEYLRHGNWQRTSLKSIRPISTVVMDEEDKEGLLRDIESFLDPGALTWHANRGIPYRRGYLLYGPPGTGKSSLCLSLAGHFGLDMYILNLSGTHGVPLDQALIRAGRVDRKLELPNADEDAAFRLFCMVFKGAKGDIPDPKRKAEDDDDTVENYGRQFVRKIPDGEFSPAEIQSYLVEHRGSARMALGKVQEWMDRTRTERAKMARANAPTAASPSTM